MTHIFRRARDGPRKKLEADHLGQGEKLSDEAIDNGGDAAHKATGDKVSGQIDSTTQKADDQIGS